MMGPFSKIFICSAFSKYSEHTAFSQCSTRSAFSKIITRSIRYKVIKTKQDKQVNDLWCVSDEAMSGEIMFVLRGTQI